jgi:Protein of unknown function (DUF2974)
MSNWTPDRSRDVSENIAHEVRRRSDLHGIAGMPGELRPPRNWISQTTTHASPGLSAALIRPARRPDNRNWHASSARLCCFFNRDDRLVCQPYHVPIARVPLIENGQSAKALGLGERKCLAGEFQVIESYIKRLLQGSWCAVPTLQRPRSPGFSEEDAAGARGCRCRYSALNFLVENKLAKPDEVYLMGKSAGGSATLTAMTTVQNDHRHQFAAGFSIVPPCINTEIRHGNYYNPISSSVKRTMPWTLSSASN